MSSSQEATEIDSEGSSCEERESRRQLFGDGESAPKKRRKQSTPVKFSTSLSVGEGDESEEEEQQQQQPAETRSPSSHDYEREGKLLMTSSPTVNSKSIQGHPSSIKDENLNNEFRCQYCSHFFDNRVTLELHLECEHNLVLSVNNAAAALQQHSNRQQQTSPSSRSSPPIQARLSPESSSQLPNSEQSISPMNLSGISIRNFATSASWLPGQQQMQSQSETSLSKLPSRNSNHFPPMPPGFPGPLAPFLPMPGFPLPDSTQLKRPAMGQFPKIFNREAYCDLCNRELCNKYFLKTHLANKHGIYIDPPASTPQNNDSNSRPFPTTLSPVSHLQNNPVPKLSETPQRLENNEVQQQQQQPTLPCDMCPKLFKNEDSLRKHKNKIHLNPTSEVADSTQTQINFSSSVSEDSRQSPVGMETLFKQEFNVEQEDIGYAPTPRSITVSPQSVQQLKESPFNGDHLRRLGVMNPEAFCEICCKEYNNKYFLRVHKLKRHGLFIPDNDKSPSTPGSAPWHQIQTSPLNLIMGDSLGTGSESGDRIEEYGCKLCGIRFQNHDLFQLHVEKIHGETLDPPSPKPDQEIDTIDQRTDSISEDLQKLQTMILQLNGLESNKAASCALCGKDYDSPTALRNHMIAEHNILSENLSTQQQHLIQEKSPPTTVVNQICCPSCDKEFPEQELLKKHIAEDHQPSTPTSSTPQLPSSVPTTPKSNSSQQGDRKASSSLTPTSSYCEICNKELCNKYFMKTHMQKMHGIEIENGAQIGGVVCNICKKELCSKYFLRVHKQNTHGIVEEGTTTTTVNKQESFESSSSTENVALRPDQFNESHRYITHYTEACPICNRRFKSPKWLKQHIYETHGPNGIEKWREMEQLQQTIPRPTARVPTIPKSTQQQQPPQPPTHGVTSLKIPNGFDPNQQIRADLAVLGNQVLSNFFGGSSDDPQGQLYRCSQLNCNFTTSILPLFFLHERSHNHQENIVLENEQLLQCPICAQTFSNPELLRQHMISRHPNPFPGLLSQFPIPLLNEFAISSEAQQQPQHQDKNDYPEIKEDIRQPSPQIMNEIDTNKMKKQEENNAVQVMPQGTYKCAQCGYATANLNRIKKHVKKDHKSLGDPTETALAELTRTLKDVANKHKVPASYAVPQDASLIPDKTIMQPFIIEELGNSQNNGNGENNCNSNDEEASSKRFAPALVFLPVKTRVSGALTMSFTLNPA